MWEKVALHPTGYLDGRATSLGANSLGLDSFRIGRHEDGNLIPRDVGGPIFSECPIVLHDGHGHFKALFLISDVPPASLMLL